MSSNHRIIPDLPDDVKQTIPYIQKLFILLLIHIGLLISMLMIFFITSKYFYLNILWLILFNAIMIGGMLWFHNSFVKKKIRLFLLTEELIYRGSDDIEPYEPSYQQLNNLKFQVPIMYVFLFIEYLVILWKF